MSVDKSVDKKVVEFLRHLGLSIEERTVYLHLLAHGPHTVLALSRGIKTGRTKLYPLLDELADKQLVTIYQRHYGTTYQASPPAALETLVAQTEHAAAQLRMQLPRTLQSLEQIHQTAPTSSFITEYPGVDGLKQLYWQTSQYTGERVIAPYKAVRKQLGSTFVAKHPIEDTIVNHSLDHEVHLYDTTVALLRPTGGVAIHNKELVDSYRQLFGL